MPLAAPLILPFAELAGITIAGLGMAAASQKVSDFISDNPELSKQILTTLLPGGQGLNALFKKEADITLEDVEEMTDEEAQNLSKEDKAEIMKEVGKSKGGDKRQRMIEISEKLGLSGEGKEKQKIFDEVEERYDEGGVEDAPKPKFDYKKFFRKADGGRVPYQSGGILEGVKNIINEGLDKGSDVGNFLLSQATRIPGIGLGIGALQALNQNRFSNLPIGDQLFITEQGDLTGGNKDKYGYNIRSAFGNYADLVSRRADMARQRSLAGQRQRAIDEYYLNLEKERQAAEAEAQRRAAIATSQMATANRAGGTGGYQSDFAQDSGFMGGSGTAAEMGSFKDGGVITLFVETK